MKSRILDAIHDNEELKTLHSDHEREIEDLRKLISDKERENANGPPNNSLLDIGTMCKEQSFSDYLLIISLNLGKIILSKKRTNDILITHQRPHSWELCFNCWVFSHSKGVSQGRYRSHETGMWDRQLRWNSPIVCEHTIFDTNKHHSSSCLYHRFLTTFKAN